MRITLITVGKIKEKYFTDAIAEYQKRLSRYRKLEILEVADEKTPDGASAAIEEQIKEKRSRACPESVKRTSAYTIALAIDGKQMTSENFAEKDPGSWYPWGEPYLLSDRRITWHVGQSPSPADERISFSKMTFPHQLMSCDPSGTDLSRFPNHPSRTIS